ncbi:FecR domain-containing protein [Caulobacter sp. BK020]|uniref:FecR family protein n=1 Tax=Caulobacter sp. BK020 TaxID=2512117 RepID=UPI00104E9BCF|nr:FecR domain-containing protein [Caulobacter sp. BK020]TCS15283.1 FecR family protein [Caulobacter sp. BK020]
MTPTIQTPANDHDRSDVYDAAATWHERKAAPGWSAADDRALTAWLEADPVHARAYDDMGEVGGLVDAAAAMGGLDLELARARHAVRSGAVRRPRRAFGLLAAGLVGATVLVGGAGLAWRMGQAPAAVTYAAASGRPTNILLADGSRVSLDGGAEVQAAMGRRTREVALTRGRAFFDVAHDASRPFEVTGGGHVIRALGTAFEVDLAAPTAPLRVALLRGRVQVRDAAGAGRPVELSPGQVMVADAKGREQVSSEDVAAATAWREGRLVLRGETLEAATAELNRRGGRKVIVTGAARDLHISGAFRGDDPEAFARAAAAVHDLAIGRAADGAIVLSLARDSGATAD